MKKISKNAVISYGVLLLLVMVTVRYVCTSGHLLAHHDGFFFALISAVITLIFFFCRWLSVKKYNVVTFLSFIEGLFFVTVAIAGGNLWALCACLWVLILSLVVGNSLINLLTAERWFTPLEKSAIAVNIGLGAFSLVIFALAAAGFLYVSVIYCFLALVSLVWIKDILNLLTGIFNKARSSVCAVDDEISSYFAIFLLVTIFVMVCINFIGAVAPEIQYDSLNYHLTVPKIYLEQHKIVDLPYIMQSYFMKSVEMLYALCMALAGQIAAKLLSFSGGLLATLLVFVIAKRFYSIKTAILAAAFFYTMPLVSWLSTTTYNELLICSYLTAALFTLLRWSETNEKNLLFLCGLLSAFALSAKLYAVLLLLPMAAGVGVLSYLHASDKNKFLVVARDLLLFGAPILVFAVLWSMPTYFQTGNPVFPFFNAIFNSSLTATTNSFMNLKDFGMGNKIWNFLLLPWNTTFFSGKFLEASNGVIGVVFLLSLLSFFHKKKNKSTYVLMFISGGSILSWFFVAQYLRYLVPVFVLLSILSAYAVQDFMEENSPLFRRICCTTLIICFVATIPIYLTSFWNIPGRVPFKVALGVESWDYYLSRAIRTYDVSRYLNNKYLPDKIKVLLIGGENKYYLDARADNLITSLSINLGRLQQDSAVSYLREQGFTHILIETSSPFFKLVASLQKDMIKKHQAGLEFSSKDVELYKLR